MTTHEISQIDDVWLPKLGHQHLHKFFSSRSTPPSALFHLLHPDKEALPLLSVNGRIRLELPVEYGPWRAIIAPYPYHRSADYKAHGKVTVSKGTVRIHCTTDTVTIPRITQSLYVWDTLWENPQCPSCILPFHTLLGSPWELVCFSSINFRSVLPWLLSLAL